jgi:hypothetical protein
MRALSSIACLMVLLLPLVSAAAEPEATALDSLVVEIWPDYDKAAVLVLLTGTLPANSPLPARVTLPLPATAQVNAVARIDPRDGVMRDDILSSPSIGELTLITPDPAFRVEYYQPYAVTDKQRTFDFTWQAGLSVASFRVKVQRPAAATSFRTVPTTTDIVRNANEINYHTFAARSVPAGTPFKLHVGYEMDLPRLTVQIQPPPSPVPAQSRPSARALSDRPGTHWPLLAILAGSLLVVLALIWMVVTRRSSVATDQRRQGD